MIRLILIPLLLSVFMQINAQSIIVNTYDDESYFLVAVPFSQFFFSTESDVTQYQLSLNLIDVNKKSIFQQIFNIFLEKDKIPQKSAYVVDFQLAVQTGQYKLVTLLRNPKLGDKKERQFDVLIEDITKTRNKNFILAENTEIKFLPSGFDQLVPDLKSCFLILDTTAEYDSLLLRIAVDSNVININIPSKTGPYYDLLPILQTGRISDMELKYYSANVLNIVKHLLYQSNDSFNQRFSHSEQIQQIRYIANQNEWKSISRIAKKDPEGAIEYFWERHNTSPGTFNNELRELFNERVVRADELFTIHKKMPGWRSDRGRIYIMKGPPDDIVEETFPIGRYPYIIWYYFRDNSVYRFYDKTGYGNYKLEGEYYEN